MTLSFTEFQKFMFTTNAIGVAVGFSIGSVTKDLVTQAVREPLENLIGMIPNNASPILDNPFFKSIIKILWSFIIWVLTLLVTFVLLELILNRQVFGLKSVLSEAQLKLFNNAKL